MQFGAVADSSMAKSYQSSRYLHKRLINISHHSIYPFSLS